MFPSEVSILVGVKSEAIINQKYRYPIHTNEKTQKFAFPDLLVLA
jgi:hypothetical protein